MTWKTGTIRLDAATSIFKGVTFSEIKIQGQTVGYKAVLDPGVQNEDIEEMSDQSLTSLCQRLWIQAVQKP